MTTTTAPGTPTTATNSGAGGGTTINFKNNCIICLLPEDPPKMLEILQKNPKNLRTFQPVVHYLSGTDPTYGRSQEECVEKDLPVMKNLPTLCAKCYDIAADIYRLHAELLELQLLIQCKTENLRKIVSSTRRSRGRIKSYKNQFLVRLRSSGMPELQVEAMSNFVDKFHGRIIAEGGKKVIFPSHPPPNFLPLPKQAVTPVVLFQIPMQQVQQQQQQQVQSTSGPSSMIQKSILTDTMPTAITTTAPPPPLSSVATVSSSLVNGARNPNEIFNIAPKLRHIQPTVVSRNKVTSLTTTTKVAESITAPISTTSITAKSDIVMLPGHSALVKFENENEYEEEEDPAAEKDMQMDDKLETELAAHEETRTEMIFPDEDDVPPPQTIYDGEEGEDTSDADWEMEEDDDDDNDSSDYESEDTDYESRKSCHRKGQLKSGKKSAKTQPPTRAKTLPIEPASFEIIGKQSQEISIGNDTSKADLGISRNANKRINGSSKFEQHEISKKIECEACNVDLSLIQLASHTRDHLGGQDGHSCPQCHRTFLSRSKLLQHWQVRLCGKQLRMKMGNNKFNTDLICTICPTSDTSNASSDGFVKYTLPEFRTHVFTKHETDSSLPRTYACALCHTTFRTEHGLDFHLNMHSHSTKRYDRVHWDICPPGAKSQLKYGFYFKKLCTAYQCDVCQDYSHYSDLENHIREEHGDNFLKCFLCRFVCTKLATYLHHLKKYHENNKWPCEIICHLCEVVFSKTFEFRVHLYQRHGLGNALLSCSFCNKKFAEEKVLEKHIKQTHKNQTEQSEEKESGKNVSGASEKNQRQKRKKVTCLRCGFCSSGSVELRRHEIRTHQNNPIACESCKKHFSFQEVYNMHMKTTHHHMDES